jgi:hypothetical protein
LDDPQTPPFEGSPSECGLQRDAEGFPKAGPFIIAHGAGEVRACDANQKNCGECRGPGGGKAPGCAVDH